MKTNSSNGRSLKILVCVLIAALVILGSVSAAVYADQDTQKKSNTKDESVYILTDASGEEYERIVSTKGELQYDGFEDCQAPVTMKISYSLDGKSITPEKLAGKSGKVVMDITYTNHLKSGNVYVPFLAVSGMILDENVFTDVEVENGKVIDDGSRLIVLGYSMPGLRESLGLSEDKLAIPEHVQVSMEAKNFQLDTIYTFLTGDIFSELNLDENTELSDLSGQLSKLTDGVDALLEGSGQLYDGTQQLQKGAEKLTEGTKTLNEGAQTLYTGSKSLQSGASKLQTGTDSLKTGADTLQTGAAQLKSGADTLSTGLSQLSANSEAINNGAKALLQSILQSASSQLAAAGMNVTLTAENYSTVLGQAIAASTGDAKTQLTAVKSQLDQVMTFYNGVLNYTAGVDSAATGAGQLSGGIDSVAAGAKSLSDGASALKSGQDQLSTGIDSVVKGAKALSQGTSQLYTKEGDLVEGIDKLNAGAKELSEGVTEMAEKGLSQLANLSDGDLSLVMDRLQQLQEASKGYKSFEEGGNYESVKFIYKTQEIRSKKN